MQDGLALIICEGRGVTDQEAATELRLSFRTMFHRGGATIVEVFVCPFDHAHTSLREAVSCVRIEALADHPAWQRTRLRWNRKHPVTFSGLAKDYLAAHPHEDFSNKRGRR